VQTSPLEGTQAGRGAGVARIAGHAGGTQVRDKPREWRPLVYCWRGGQRSGSLALVLSQIGFRTAQLQGGYKAFRARVRDDLAARCRRCSLPRAVRPHRQRQDAAAAGAARRAGAQVLDLEGLAHHRGSVLGGLPGLPQPTQKHFDTRVWQALARLQRPGAGVRGKRKCPHRHPARARGAAAGHARSRATACACTAAMPPASTCCWTTTASSTQDAEPLCQLLDGLVELQGRERVKHWQALARAGRWPDLIADLMAQHYDPLYERSMRRSYPTLDQAPRVELHSGTPPTWPTRPHRCWGCTGPPQLLDLPHEPAGRPQAGCTTMELRNQRALAESRTFTVRPIPTLRPLGWLARGWRDLMRCPLPGCCTAWQWPCSAAC
jgi:tRNA 2-selenouridine synthase